MKFANRLFTLSFTLSLWLVLLGLRTPREMWLGSLIFFVLLVLTGIWCDGYAKARHEQDVQLMEMGGEFSHGVEEEK